MGRGLTGGAGVGQAVVAAGETRLEKRTRGRVASGKGGTGGEEGGGGWREVGWGERGYPPRVTP